MAAKQGSSPKVKRAGKNRRVVADPKPVNRRGGGKPPTPEITSWKRVQGTQKRVFDLTIELLQARLGEGNVTMAMELQIKWLCGTREEPFLDEEPLMRHPELEKPTEQDWADERVLWDLQKSFFGACMATPDSKFAVHDDCRQVIRGRMERFFLVLLEQQQEQEEQERQRRAASRRNRNPRAIPNGMAQQLRTTGHAAMVDQQRQQNRSALAATVATRRQNA